MRKLLFITLGLLASVPSLLGQGTEALTFTRIDRNPATSAFAGAGSASTVNTAYSAFSNASVLPFHEGTMDAAVSFQHWSPDVAKASHINAGAAFKISPRIGVSLGYAMQRGSAYDIFDEQGIPGGRFTPSEQLFAMGVGFGLGERLSIGANVRYALQQLNATDRYSGISGDLFLACQVLTGLRLTAGVSTLGTKVIARDETSYGQPASFKAGAEGILRLNEANSLTILADADYCFAGGISAAAGLQYAWKDILFLRGGYRLADKRCVIPGHAALGLGVQLSGIRLELSWLTASPALRNSLSAGVGYRF